MKIAFDAQFMRSLLLSQKAENCIFQIVCPAAILSMDQQLSLKVTMELSLEKDITQGLQR